MKYFPRYRIYTLVGWTLPLFISILLVMPLDVAWYWKVLLCVFLYPLVFILEIIIYKELTDVWNTREG